MDVIGLQVAAGLGILISPTWRSGSPDWWGCTSRPDRSENSPRWARGISCRIRLEGFTLLRFKKDDRLIVAIEIW